MDSNAFLAGLAVGRRLKGWASGGDLKINVGADGADSSACTFWQVAEFTFMLRSFSSGAVEVAIPQIADYTEE